MIAPALRDDAFLADVAAAATVEEFARVGTELGIAHVESSPFTRSSHHAAGAAAAAAGGVGAGPMLDTVEAVVDGGAAPSAHVGSIS